MPPTLKINITFPDNLRRNLARLSETGANKVVRAGLRAATSPAKNELKKEVRKITRQSRQSTGATARAVQSNFRYPSKSKKHYGYMNAGIDYHYNEAHMVNRPLLTAMFKGKGQVTRDPFIGFSNYRRTARYSNGKKKALQKKLVKSYQKSHLRIKRSNKGYPIRKPRTYQLNRPGKYWHLIEDGFQHRGGKKFPGYKFLSRSGPAAAPAMINAFDKKFAENFQREITRR